MNEYDSHRMADLLGFTWLCAHHNPNEADILLMNTCSIREKAQKSVQWNWVVGVNSKKNPDLVIGVGGCVASQEGDNIQKRAYVDMVLVHKPCTFATNAGSASRSN